MSNFSKSTSFLDQFSSDLNNLYCFTKDARIENLFIKVAESNEAEIKEFLGLLYKGKYKNLNISKDVIGALSLLSSIPKGIAQPEFVKAIVNDPQNRKYLPTIICIGRLRGLKLSILYPFSNVLALTDNFEDRPEEEMASVSNDINIINNELQAYLKSKTDLEYEDELVAKQPKQTKKEKIRTMTMFLLDKFSGEITNGFQNSHLSSIASQIGNSLLDPSKIASLIPDMNINAGILTQEAISIAKEVLRKIEPHNLDSNYGYIKARIFRFTGVITSSEFNEFYSKVLTQELNKTYGTEHDNEMEVTDLNIRPNQWTNPTAVILLSLILIRITSQSN